MAENGNLVSIEILDNDCLLTIFCHLTILDRIKIERVNKRWNELSKSGESWRDIKKLDLDPRSWGFKPSEFLLDSKEIKLFELEEVLKRCGKFLEDIDFTDYYEDTIVNVIASYCPNIKIFKGRELDYDIIKLAENCENIVELSLSFCYAADHEISCLLKRNKNLRKLKLHNSPRITGSCLLNLPLLESLDLTLKSLKKQHVVNAIKIMKNLKVLKIVLFNDIANDVIVVLQNCLNLEELHLTGQYQKEDFPDEDEKLAALFRNNKKLKTLSFERCFLYGDCLSDLNGDCMEELLLDVCPKFDFYYLNKYSHKFNNLNKFAYTGWVSNYCELIACFSSLLNLKYLELFIRNHYETDIDNKFFSITSKLEKLEELILKGSFVTDESLAIIRENCKNLKTLCLNECENVTDIGLYAITGLPKLEALSLYEMDTITSNGFNKMENLKKLKCRFSENIKNEGFFKILRESEKLEYLEMFDDFVTEDLLLFANEITMNRKNNTILYIHKDIFLNIDPENLNNVKKSPFLEFTDKNLF